MILRNRLLSKAGCMHPQDRLPGGSSRLAAFLATTALLMILLPVVSSSPARASFPGRNGEITFAAYPCGFYVSDTCNDPITMYSISPRGGAIVPIGRGSYPAWSADGAKVAFASCDPDCGIWIANADGSERTRIPRSASYGIPSWSPSGNKIVFSRCPSHKDCELFTVKTDGTGLLRLTNNRAEEIDPKWSPDGRRILFQGKWTWRQPRIFTLRRDGTHRRFLARGGNPDWHPSGRSILFSRKQQASDEDVEKCNLKRMKADGSSVRLIATVAATYDCEVAPVWSPNGRRIAFLSSLQSVNDLSAILRVMRPDGSDRRTLFKSSEYCPEQQDCDPWPWLPPAWRALPPPAE